MNGNQQGHHDQAADSRFQSQQDQSQIAQNSHISPSAPVAEGTPLRHRIVGLRRDPYSSGGGGAAC